MFLELRSFKCLLGPRKALKILFKTRLSVKPHSGVNLYLKLFWQVVLWRVAAAIVAATITAFNFAKNCPPIMYVSALGSFSEYFFLFLGLVYFCLFH